MSTVKELNAYKNIYFIGIGGIGMSALARYFNQQNYSVAGYDKTRTALTENLQKEGIPIHFNDDISIVPDSFKNPIDTLIVYTPAIPQNMSELNYFRSQNFAVVKRSEVLGMITRNSKALGVAGTHGKTTTSCLLAYILDQSKIKCNAFLGGISSNFNTNFISSSESDYTVIEADEFDRSFLQLNPFASIVTSIDADHLDIYNDEKTFHEGFERYAALIDPSGILIQHENVSLSHPNSIRYGLSENVDYRGMNIRVDEGRFLFDLQTPTSLWEEIELGIPGIHNIENAIACIAMSDFLGLSEETIRQALKSFKGVKRRFEYHIKNKETVYIDDYAHHPTELKAFIDSVKLAFPNRKITGIFQPHLFSRTQDFWNDFILQLSRLDEIYLMPIYPAREEPIPGVTSENLLKEIQSENKFLMNSTEIMEDLKEKEIDVILTMGAGNIDQLVLPLTKLLKNEKVD